MKIKVLVFRVGAEPVVEEIEDNLEAMQKIVGGYIGGHFFGLPRVQLICNDDGKIQGLPPNRFCAAINDVIVGDFFISRHNLEGDSISLSEEDIDFAKQAFSPVVVI